jgi:hypothetical protein
MGLDNDAVDERRQTLCCALCCVNCAYLDLCECTGCSGKIGCCCLNCEVCCKPGAPCLPLCCCGPKFDCNNACASCVNTQLQFCCIVLNAAFPCNEEVPLAISIAGMTLYPKCGCCIKQSVSIASCF